MEKRAITIIEHEGGTDIYVDGKKQTMPTEYTIHSGEEVTPEVIKKLEEAHIELNKAIDNGNKTP